MRYLLIFVFQLICIAAGAQQKAMFTQYMFNGLAVNPAYSAIDEALNITALTRHQWVGFEGAPNTQSLTVHTPIKESNTSVGIMLMRDQIGEVIRENGAFATLTQRVQVSDETYLAAGVNVGVGGYRADYSQISDGSDPAFLDQNETRANLGFGVMLFSNKFYAGFSSPFFYYRSIAGVSDMKNTAYRPHYMLQGGYLADLGSDFKLKPNALVKYVAGAPVQIDLNVNILIKETVWLGASWRSFDSFDFIAELQLTPQIQLGYAYDFTTTELAKVQKGSHEIMLNFRLPIRGRSFPRCYF